MRALGKDPDVPPTTQANRVHRALSRPSLATRLCALALAFAPGLASAATADAQKSAPASESSTVITSYGEINYNRPADPAEARIDLRRFVLGLQHRFDEKTKLVTELEVEHAVSSAGDKGEVEIEQAYIERQFGEHWAGRAGLFLVPFGLLNENHEPTAYYGVERNFVETAIIPTTWREGGVQAVFTFDPGFTLQAGVSTGFDINKWDATSIEGRASPLASIHQELQLARARDLAGFGALNWRGIPGLQLGGALFVGNAAQGQTGSAVVALWDVHARYNPGRLDLSALYARGTISNTAALNAPLAGNPTLIPEAFDGWYVQAAYRLWTQGDMALAPFARYEQFNTGRSYADLGSGAPAGLPTERVVTAGLNYYVTPEVVVKADVQRFHEDTSRNRFDLGLGWSF